MHRLPPRIRALLRLDPVTGCWLFAGRWTTGNGYGKLRWNQQHRVIHRVVWTLLRGPICPTFQLDHECRVRLCSNPDHLAPMPSVVNTHRGRAVLFKPLAEYCS